MLKSKRLEEEEEVVFKLEARLPRSGLLAESSARLILAAVVEGTLPTEEDRTGTVEALAGFGGELGKEKV